MYKNILVPVVLDENHDAQGSFLIAKAFAAQGAHFTILHVIEAIPGFVAAQIPADVLAATRGEVDKHLAQLAKALPQATTALVSGHAGRTIVDYASKHDIDCIVLASHQPGLENFFLGSTADRVVRHAKCSVHVIR